MAYSQIFMVNYSTYTYFSYHYSSTVFKAGTFYTKDNQISRDLRQDLEPELRADSNMGWIYYQ